MASSPATQPLGQAGGATKKKLLLRRRRSPSVAGAARRVEVVPYVDQLPATYGRFELQDATGRTLCWNLGRQSAEQFVAARAPVGADDALFKPAGDARVFVFFPIGDAASGSRSYVKRVFRLTGVKRDGVTLRRVLGLVEQASVVATRHALSVGGAAAAAVTEPDVRRALTRVIVCHLMCTRVGAYHVYVRNSFDTA
jgi:hypothetical protein